MERSRRFLLLCPACLLATAALAAGTGVQVTDGGLALKPITDGPNQGLDAASHGFVLSNGACRYGITYSGYWDKQGGAKPTEEGYLGMPVPTSCNWYGGGFMAISANGKGLGNTRPLPPRVVEKGARGLVELLFPTSPSPVRLRFLLEPDSDFLACEIASKTPLASLNLQLNCFPSYFTAWNHKDGWRQVLSSTQTLEQGQDAALAVAPGGWLFYQDKIFDCATNPEAEGPCAVLVLPEQVQGEHVRVGSYGVPTDLVYKPGQTSVRLAFWDFHQQGNAVALKHLREIAPQVAERLRQLDFNDAGVAAFDATAERAKLETLIAHTAYPAKWRESLLPTFEAITAALQAYQGGDYVAEQQAAEAIARYREALWDLRFDALLTD